MTITPIKAFNDNYIWIVQSGNQAACIDPGEHEPVLAFLIHNRLMLAQTWITHHHHDHCGGILPLKRVYMSSPVYGASDIEEATHTVEAGNQFSFGDGLVTVWATPGHTAHHVSYLLENADGLHVFCGDTVFSAGCGRVFTGTVEELFDSFNRLNQLPESTLFYPAHEYTASNLRFAAHIEPDNADIQTALNAALQQDAPTLPVTLAHERAVNPFFRVGLPQVWSRAETLCGRKLHSELEVFAALRELKNTF
ncbi:hydroxyacylglutathione hydrolase [Neisseria animalis]|uniref:Hydroxyacylglutathione hydrolase n=1 Tax=Neisseria animalis TaxID=492 RepID=A0A5P3MTC7_NEIAN|nr:hydroxyacylglutathione hydrolase [Neisseria animalis]QEY24867.1 hydroxyacylglutathione hydrolase [Neisseria animalis]ROW32397.1 hydroxyacylglutathione hydrolase [Neisseria animalis]VEE08045.1 hydroxyacylglutathione hydrolase [Neisseria animalis]